MRDPDTTPDDRARLFEMRLGRAGLGLVPRLGGRLSDALLDRLFQRLAARHPRAFATLRSMPEASLRIEPVDTPAALTLRVGPALSLRVTRRDDDAGPDAARPDAIIRGPYARLLDLLEGRIDGDALFFRRELAIEGDTALILALRNTLDGEEMDLMADAASIAGPLARVLPVLRRNAGPALDRLEAARRLLPPPLRRGLDRVEARLAGTRPASEV